MAQAAVCTFTVSLVLLRWSTTSPITAAPIAHPVSTRTEAPALALDNVDLSRVSLGTIEALARRPAEPRPGRDTQYAEPDRHSERKPAEETGLA
jgi:hypothetical protein